MTSIKNIDTQIYKANKLTKKLNKSLKELKKASKPPVKRTVKVKEQKKVTPPSSEDDEEKVEEIIEEVEEPKPKLKLKIPKPNLVDTKIKKAPTKDKVSEMDTQAIIKLLKAQKESGQSLPKDGPNGLIASLLYADED
jgi:hypothetical protein